MVPKKKISFSITIALAVFFLSMFFDVIPCQTAPNVPNPQYSWTTCNLNPDISKTGIQRKYFGYTTSIRESYILSLVIVL